MNISNVAPLMANADLPAEQLGANAHLSEPEKVKRLSRQFEALLARQILQEARKTVIPSKFTTDSATNAIYQDMVNYQLAEGISHAGGFGLAATLEKQLTRQLHHTPKPPPAPAPAAADPKRLTQE
jgi:Rod binding domain-containing protein